MSWWCWTTAGLVTGTTARALWGTSAAAGTVFKEDLREAGCQLMQDTIESQHITVEELPRPVRRQGGGTGVCHMAVHVPLYIGHRISPSASYLFPPSAIAAHVSAVPNHQTGRMIPFETRAALASSANMVQNRGQTGNVIRCGKGVKDSFFPFPVSIWASVIYSNPRK